MLNEIRSMIILLASAPFNRIQKSRSHLEENTLAVTKSRRLMVFGEIISVYCVNDTKRTDMLHAHNTECLILNKVVHVISTLL